MCFFRKPNKKAHNNKDCECASSGNQTNYAQRKTKSDYKRKLEEKKKEHDLETTHR